MSEDQFSAIVEDLEKISSGTVILLEDLSLLQPTSPCLKWLVERRHLLLPHSVAKLSMEVQRHLEEVGDNAGFLRMYDTGTGNEVWEGHMFPVLAEAKDNLVKQDWRAGFARLLGILFYASGTEAWIADNEVWIEERRFTKWFSDYGGAWRKVLGRSDQELGLDMEGGREGGYRDIILEMVGSWQKETNELLDDLYNKDHGYSVKVKIVDTTETDSLSDDSSETSEESESDESMDDNESQESNQLPSTSVPATEPFNSRKSRDWQLRLRASQPPGVFRLVVVSGAASLFDVAKVAARVMGLTKEFVYKQSSGKLIKGTTFSWETTRLTKAKDMKSVKVCDIFASKDEAAPAEVVMAVADQGGTHFTITVDEVSGPKGAPGGRAMEVGAILPRCVGGRGVLPGVKEKKFNIMAINKVLRGGRQFPHVLAMPGSDLTAVFRNMERAHANPI